MTSAPGQPGRDDAAEPDPDGLGEAIRTGRVPVVPGSLVDLVMRSGSAGSPDAATEPGTDPGADATNATARSAGPSSSRPEESPAGRSGAPGPAATSTGSGFADLVREGSGHADATDEAPGSVPGVSSVAGPRPTPSPRPGPAPGAGGTGVPKAFAAEEAAGDDRPDDTSGTDGDGYYADLGDLGDDPLGIGPLPDTADAESADPLHTPADRFAPPPSFAPDVDGSPVNSSPVNSSPLNGSPVISSPLNGAPVDGSSVGGAPVDGAPADGAPADGAAPDGSTRTAGPAMTGPASTGPAERARNTASAGNLSASTGSTERTGSTDHAGDMERTGSAGTTGSADRTGAASRAGATDRTSSTRPAEPLNPAGSAGPTRADLTGPTDSARRTGPADVPDPTTTGDTAGSTDVRGAGDARGSGDSTGSATSTDSETVEGSAAPTDSAAPEDSGHPGTPVFDGEPETPTTTDDTGDAAPTPATGRPRMGGDRLGPGDVPPTQPAPTVVPPIAPSPRPLDEDTPVARPVRAARPDESAPHSPIAKRWPPRPGADGPETDILPPGALLGHYPAASANTAAPSRPAPDARPATPSSGIRPTMPGRRRPAQERSERESTSRPAMGGAPSGPAMTALSGSDLFATPSGGTGRGFGELPTRTSQDAEPDARQDATRPHDDSPAGAGTRTGDGSDAPADRPVHQDRPAGPARLPQRPEPHDDPARGAPAPGAGSTGRTPSEQTLSTPARRNGNAAAATTDGTGAHLPAGGNTGSQPHPRSDNRSPWAQPDGRPPRDPARRAGPPARPAAPVASDATVTIPALDDDGRPRHAITPPPGRGPRPISGRTPQEGRPSARPGRGTDGADGADVTARVAPVPAAPAQDTPPTDDTPHRAPGHHDGAPGTDTGATDDTENAGGTAAGNVAAAASLGAVSVAAARAASGRDGAVTDTGPRTEVRPAGDAAPEKPITPRREAIMSAKPRNGRRGVSPAGLAIALAIVLLGTLTLWAMFAPGSIGDGAGTDRPATDGAPAAGLGPQPDAGPAAASLSSPTVRATVPVGAEPVAVAATADGRTALVAVADEPRLVVLDGATDAVTAEIPLPATPQGVTTSPDGTRAFVSLAGPDGGQLAVVDVPGAAVLGVTSTTADPAGAIVAPDGRFLYVPSRAEGVVDELDPYAGTVTRSVPVSRDPFAAATNDAGDRIYLATRGADQLTVLDPSSLTVLRSYPVRGGAEAVAVSAGPETQVAVGGPGSNTVTVLDPADGREIAGAETRGGPTGLAFAPDGRHLYAVTDQGLQVIRTSTWREAGSTDVALNPTAIAVSPDGRTGWVTGDGEVSVLDLA
ncbi:MULTISPECIES: hypothetical protein [Pseudonocardia]|uniref:Lactonase, 7-bladed beta-propeller n=2 Tax=Pseudonocardia TaxID=1847 RepID=A0A1Y2MLM9_PSEAH|nr:MULTISPECIES: hypothetical protein [Pseudonocardia]OSY36150.1 hypothetical protein BG845_05548 [Pseudonocardia autotrophica]TDN76583.1 collagen type III alpha [Pseudonocardia autotrophica]